MSQLLLSYFIYGVLLGGCFGLISIGLSILYGIMGVVNFAHGELFMLGAYITYFSLKSYGLDISVSLLLTGCLMFISGMVIDRLLFRPVRMMSFEYLHDSSIMLTLGLSMILQNAALLGWGPEYRSVEFVPGVTNLFGIPVENSRLFAFIVSVVLGAGFWLFASKTKVGTAIRAVTQDLEGAKLVGIDTERIFTLVVGISSALTGIAGGILLPIFMAYPTVGLRPIDIGFAVVILGGLGSIEGAIIGGFIIGIADAFTSALIGPAYETMLGFAIIIIILIVRPWGLLGKEWRK